MVLRIPFLGVAARIMIASSVDEEILGGCAAPALM